MLRHKATRIEVDTHQEAQKFITEKEAKIKELLEAKKEKEKEQGERGIAHEAVREKRVLG